MTIKPSLSAILYILQIIISCDSIDQSVINGTVLTYTPENVLFESPTFQQNSSLQHLSSVDGIDGESTRVRVKQESVASETSVMNEAKMKAVPTLVYINSQESNSSKEEIAHSSTMNDTRRESTNQQSGITNSHRLTSGLSVSNDQEQGNHMKDHDDAKKLMHSTSHVLQSNSQGMSVTSENAPPPQTVDKMKLATLTTEMSTSAQVAGEKVSTDTSNNDRNSPLRCYTCNLPGFPKCDDPFLLENGKLAECPSADGKRYFCGKLRGVISSLPESSDLTLSLTMPKIVPISESIDKWTSNVTNNVTFRIGDEFIARLCFPKLHEYVWRREPYNLTHKHGDITVVGRVYLCRNTRCNKSHHVNANQLNFILSFIILNALKLSFHSLSIVSAE